MARARGNPPVTMFLNPGRGTRRRKRSRGISGTGRLVSQAAKEIWYVHEDDGVLYRHDFTRGTSIEFLPDGSARIFRPDGKPLWKDFR
jgi:hypothetical protein